MHWAASGRGKRGGAGVVYYHYASSERIYLMKATSKAIRNRSGVRAIREAAQISQSPFAKLIGVNLRTL